MKPTDTPRTDAEWQSVTASSPWDAAAEQMAQHARQLERELADLTEDVGKCHDAIGEDRASDTSELWRFFETHKQLIHRLRCREDELDQERQDRKQADLDAIRALGERNDARAELSQSRETHAALYAGTLKLQGETAEWREMIDREVGTLREELAAERALADRLAAPLFLNEHEALSGEALEWTLAHVEAVKAWKEARREKA